MKSLALLCLAFAVANAHSIYRFHTTEEKDQLRSEKDRLFTTGKYYSDNKINRFYNEEKIEKYMKYTTPRRTEMYPSNIIEVVEETLRREELPTKMTETIVEILKTKVMGILRREFPVITEKVEEHLRTKDYPTHIVEKVVEILKYLPHTPREYPEMIFSNLEQSLRNKEISRKMIEEILEVVQTKIFETIRREFPEVTREIEEHMHREEYPTHMIKKVIETLRNKMTFNKYDKEMPEIFEDVEQYLRTKDFPTKMVRDVVETLKTKVFKTLNQEFPEILEDVEEYLRNKDYPTHLVKEVIYTLKNKLHYNKIEKDLPEIFEDVEEYLEEKYPTEMVEDVVEILKNKVFKVIRKEFPEIVEDIERYLRREEYPTHMIKNVIEYLMNKMEYPTSTRFNKFDELETEVTMFRRMVKEHMYRQPRMPVHSVTPFVNPLLRNTMYFKNFSPLAHRVEMNKPELKEIRNQLDEIMETVENVDNKMNKVFGRRSNDKVTPVTYEEAIRAVRSEKASRSEVQKYGLDNMRIHYIDDLVNVKLVTPSGKTIEKPLPRGSSIITVLQPEDDLDDLKWFRIMNTNTVIYFHKGSPVKVHMIDESGRYTSKVLGDPTVFDDATFAVVVSDKVFFAPEVMDNNEVSIISYGNAPGWTKENHVVVPFEKINGDYFKLSKRMIKSFNEKKQY